MDNWHSSVVYQMATERHNEDIRRGEAARRASSITDRRPTRARLASVLVTLAAWLNPPGSVLLARRAE